MLLQVETGFACRSTDMRRLRYALQLAADGGGDALLTILAQRSVEIQLNQAQQIGNGVVSAAALLTTRGAAGTAVMMSGLHGEVSSLAAQPSRVKRTGNSTQLASV